MPLRFYFFLLALLTALTFAPPAASQTTACAIRDYLERAERFGFSGSVLVIQKGKILVKRGYGLANETTGTRVTTETPFNLASLSKQFTATAILRLEREGRLKTGDPIYLHLPGVPPDKRVVTIRHLLSHTSGLAGRLGKGRRARTRNEFLKDILSRPLESQPGERYDYSNNGYALLAAIIENASGKPYARYLREHLFQPAGMTRTVCDTERATLTGAKQTRVYNGDLDQGDAFLSHLTPAWEERGGMGVLSTAQDLYRWERALRGNAILSPTEKSKLYAPHQADYACGWIVRPSPWGRIAWHDGMILPEGWNAQYWRFLDEDSCVIVLANRYRGVPLSEPVGRTVKNLLLGMGGVLPPQGTTELGLLSRFLGRHTLPDGAQLRFRLKRGRLYAEAENQAGVDLLIGATPEQRKRHPIANANTAALLQVLREPNGNALPTLFSDPADRERAEKTLTTNYKNLTRRFGEYQAVAVLHSVSDGDFTETYAQLRFSEGETTVRFYWDGTRFAGMNDDGAYLGATPAVPVLPGSVPLVQTAPGELVTFDLATAASVRFRRVENRLAVLPNTVLPESGTLGNALFRLRGYPNARLVTLAGSFNEWQPKSVRLVLRGGEWVCRIPLPVGRYAYKFVVDGVWIPDPQNPTREDDGKGATNSVLNVRQTSEPAL